MFPRLYAQALHGAVRGKEIGEQEKCLRNLIALLRRKGHMALLSSILGEYEKILGREGDTATLTISRTSDKEALSRAQKAREKYFHGVKPRVSVDENIIGGFRIASGTRIIDASYKNALLKLYRSMVA